MQLSGLRTVFVSLALCLVTAPIAAQPASPIEAIGALAQREDIAAAMQSLEDMRDKNIERLIAITEIPAPPFAEDVRATDIAERFRKLGLNVEIDGEGNVIATRKGTGSQQGALALVAHIDTVFPAETDVTVRREGNVFYAPGIGDNSQGLVAMLALAEVLQKHDIHTKRDILFVGSVGEEGLGDLRGMRYLFAFQKPSSEARIASVIAIDGGSTSRIVTTAVGSNRYRVTFSGPGGHSYGAYGRAHPHQALAEAIARFTLAARPITEDGPKSTFSVGRIGGGTSINSIPFTSWMEVDMRSADPGKLAELDKAFKTAVNTALATENARRISNDALAVEIKSVGKRPAGSNGEGNRLVANALAAAQQLGIEAIETASSTDANIPLSLGIPAVTMSRGGISRNAHAPNESWEDRDTHVALQILLLTTIAEAG